MENSEEKMENKKQKGIWLYMYVCIDSASAEIFKIAMKTELNWTNDSDSGEPCLSTALHGEYSDNVSPYSLIAHCCLKH